MINKWFCIVGLILCVNLVSAQKQNWQQKIEYDIEVELFTEEKLLKGFNRMIYFNNSPDTLTEIYFHCWANAYSNPNTPLAKEMEKNGNVLLQLNNQDYMGYITDLDFKVNQQKVVWEKVDEFGEIIRVKLNKPLLPKQTAFIFTPFTVNLPVGEISRMGYLDGSFQITQWYPKPAVYDKNGWNTMSYLSQGEFFSEFADYTVKITLPQNYLVAATGKLTEESFLEEQKLLNSKISETQKYLQTYPYKDDKFEFKYPKIPFPEDSKIKKTLVFKEKNVHDFAWFTDNRWLVTTETVTIPLTQKSVDVYAYFLPENMQNWRHALNFMKKALFFYSDEVGIYPYNILTAIDGSISAGAGMEYPTITIIGEAENLMQFEEVLAHEIGHNWFYGILASNERQFPWMDEGLNSYLELKYFEKHYPNNTLGDLVGNWADWLTGDDKQKMRSYYYWTYMIQASRRLDQPINLPADAYTDDNYAEIVYSKSAVIFRYMQEYLGEDIMKEIIQTYFNRYKNKHVYPEDFWNVAEEVSGKKLNWMYEDLFSTKKLDYAILSAGFSETTKDLEVLVKNKGGVNSPIFISSFLNGNLVYTHTFDGFDGNKILNLGKIKADEVRIDYHEYMLEINRNNNSYKIYSIFGGIRPIKFYPITSLDNPKYHDVFISPLLGYNYHDGFKLGVVLHNAGVVEKKFRFMSTPNYGFGNKTFTGYHKAVYSFYPTDFFDKINVFGVYRNETFPAPISNGSNVYENGVIEKYELGTRLNIKNKNAKSTFKSWLTFRYTQTKIVVPKIVTNTNNYITLTYFGIQKRKYNPYGFELNAQLINADLLKFFGDAHYTVHLSKKTKSSFDFRVFGGFFATPTGPLDQQHRLRLSAHNGLGVQSVGNNNLVISGMTDYLYDDVFLGRYVNDPFNLWSKQISKADGAFRTPIDRAASSTWLSSFNVTFNSPLKFVSVFADFGLLGLGNSVVNAYGTGLQVNVVKDIFEIYFPIYHASGELLQFSQPTYINYGQQIRFKLDIQRFYNIID